MASFSSSFTSVIVVLLLLLPVLLAPPASAVPLLAACKIVGGGSTYFDVTFCLEALGSVGGGGVYRDLAAAAVGLLAANATSTEAKVSRLLRESGVALARPLRSWQSLYIGIVRRGPACTAAVKGGKFGDATTFLEKAAAAAKECGDGFRKSNAASPLTAEDYDAFKLAKLAVALLGYA